MELVCLGEAMLELRAAHAGLLQIGHAGDVLNTAVALARQGIACGFASALGDDPYSAAMRAAIVAEAVDVRWLATIPGALPGLYMIETDAAGERRFHYWRRDAAVRQLFDAPDRLAGIEQVPWLYLTGISFAIFEGPRRAALFGLIERMKHAGARIAFDPNHRPALWPDPAAARALYMQVAGLADMLLPTFDDEAQLFGDTDPVATLARLRAVSGGEIVIKAGPAGAMLWADGEAQAVPVRQVLRPLDTTGAGDAFNAGYLAARLRGGTPADAAQAGHRLAAITIMHPGGIPPRSAVAA